MKYHLDQSDEMDKRHLALWGLKDLGSKKTTTAADIDDVGYQTARV